jgi:hypothetical protein
MSDRIDVDAILASLPPAFDDPGENPWGGANLEKCGDPACRCAGLSVSSAETRIRQTLGLIAEMRGYQLHEGERDRLDEIAAALRGEEPEEQRQKPYYPHPTNPPPGHAGGRLPWGI